MLHFQVFGVSIEVSFWFFALLAGAALTGHALLWHLLLPVCIHELGHLLVLAACRVRVQAIYITVHGIDIRRAGPSPGYGREILISLGGVAANLITALVLHIVCFHSMRMLFFIAANLAVALLSLAPIGNLDGGQVLALLTARFFSPDTAARVGRIASVVVLALLLGFSVFLLSIGIVNPSLLLFCAYFAVQVLRS